MPVWRVLLSAATVATTPVSAAISGIYGRRSFWPVSTLASSVFHIRHHRKHYSWQLLAAPASKRSLTDHFTGNSSFWRQTIKHKSCITRALQSRALYTRLSVTWPLTFWPQKQSHVRVRSGLYVCKVWSLHVQRNSSYLLKTKNNDRQTNRYHNMLRLKTSI